MPRHFPFYRAIVCLTSDLLGGAKLERACFIFVASSLRTRCTVAKGGLRGQHVPR